MYGGRPISVVGQVTLPVKYNKVPELTFAFYVANLMGADLFDHGSRKSRNELAFSLRQYRARCSAFFSCLGEMKKFAHISTIREEVTLVQQPVTIVGSG